MKMFHQREEIFEDNNIIVFFSKGISSFVLITFGDLTMLDTSRDFFAQKPVENLGYTCVAFLAKWGNWYPESSVRAACLALVDILAKYNERIMYGGSMGGYAAIKFSRLMGATQVIAFCPQWSIADEDWASIAVPAGFSPGWRKYLTPSMTGMAINKEDIAGQLYIFYDPLSLRDATHASQIAKIFCHCRAMPVVNVGHHVTPVLAGTLNLSTIISGVRSGRTDMIVRLIYLARRSSSPRLRKLLEWAKRRRGDWATTGLAELSVNRNRVAADDIDFHRKLFWASIKSGNKFLAYISLEKLNSMNIKIDEYIVICCAFSARFVCRQVLRTFSGDEVVFDAAQNKCVMASSATLGAALPVTIESGPCGWSLSIQSEGLKYNLSVIAGGYLGMAVSSPANSTEARVLEKVAHGGLALALGAKYLSARTGQGIRAMGGRVGQFEIFLLGFVPA